MSGTFNIRFWGNEQPKFNNQARVCHEKGIVFINKFLKFWAIPFLVTAGIGIYLSFFIAPLVISALVAAGIGPGAALILGIATGFALVFGTVWVPLSRFLEGLAILRGEKTHAGHTEMGPIKYGYILGLLVGVGFGIYLSTLIAPAVIGALTAAGLGYGWALFVGIGASLVLIAATIDLLAQPTLIALAITRFMHLISCILQPKSDAQLLKGILSYGVAGLVGVGIGIWLAILVTPLVMSALAVVPGMNAAMACFVAVVISVALIASFARGVFALGTFLNGMICAATLFKATRLSGEALEMEATFGKKATFGKNGELEFGKNEELELGKMEILQSVILGGPVTELAFFVRTNRPHPHSHSHVTAQVTPVTESSISSHPT